jgi:hypothetical protein
MALRVIVALVVPFGWVAVLLLSVPPVRRLIRRLRR